MSEYIRQLVEIGIAVARAIKDGKSEKKISDILPQEYLDSLTLDELEEAARRDYQS